ncbi:MAG TPA: glycosyl hydrolase family 28-related protein [Candidatus Hydrogenedentes bacterium]|nr:glycosyl hydrolase family 28-related protein [Candidatus Hydrogenedentota bacterium]HOL77798.1 glycosyl hydrolase family 28-related protein [Candidatus Hydrogenedentota bacterium]HPO86860.1 glycosyl hydrolase family 28-related protein [Candidatus Hydrogenedentota bacterium]
MITYFQLLLSVALFCNAFFSAFSDENIEKSDVYSVTAFGAKGDGQTDNTSAFQEALNKASETGGTVFVPAGKFLLAGNLNVPPNVVLEGIWRGPARHKDSKGSTLLARAGKGDRDGQPFLTMNECSGLKGIVVHYPDQIDEDPPIPYPWTIRGKGDNILITDVLVTNPYQAIDFGTYPCGRHYINRFYAQALYRGIFIDKCFDVGRIENVHLWPFWSTGGPVRRFTEREGVAFIFGRTDWQFVTNTFCIGYNVGFVFQAFRDGPGNVLISQSGSDIGPCAVRVEQVQEHAGVSFVNCQMMAGVDILESNSGPVKFTATGFWPIPDTESQAKLKGKGHVFFEGCHFSDWDVPGKGAPCIEANSQGLTITGCDFMASGKKQIVLGENVKSAVITANRFRGGILIENKTSGDVQIGLNTFQ